MSRTNAPSIMRTPTRERTQPEVPLAEYRGLSRKVLADWLSGLTESRGLPAPPVRQTIQFQRPDRGERTAAPENAQDHLGKIWPKNGANWIKYLDQFERKQLSAEEAKGCVQVLQELAKAQRGEATLDLPAGFRRSGFLLDLYQSMPKEEQPKLVADLVRAASLNPQLAEATFRLLDQLGEGKPRAEVLHDLKLSPEEFRALLKSREPKEQARLVHESLAAYRKDLENEMRRKNEPPTAEDWQRKQRLGASLGNLRAVADMFSKDDIQSLFRQGPLDLGLLLRLTEHPDPEMGDLAAKTVRAMIPNEVWTQAGERPTPAMTKLRNRIQEAALRQGGELGAVTAKDIQGPLGDEQLRNMQSFIQQRLQYLVSIAEDENKLKEILGKVGDGSMARGIKFTTVQKELSDLKKLMVLKSMSRDYDFQKEKRKVIDEAGCDRVISGMMKSVHMKELMTGLHAKTLDKDLKNGPQLAGRQMDYLKSQKFRDKLLMLRTPGSSGLNDEQKKALFEGVAMAAAFEPDEKKRDAMMADVVASLSQDRNLIPPPDPKAVDATLDEIKRLCEGGSLAPEEKDALLELAKQLNDYKGGAKNLKEIYTSLRYGEKKLAQKLGVAAAETSAVAKLMKGAKLLGPAFEAWGAYQSFEDMREQIKEGNPDAAALKFGAGVAGVAAAGLGFAALCMSAGPPGWLIGGLAFAAFALGLAGAWVSKDPSIAIGERYNLVRNGLPDRSEVERRNNPW